MRIDTKTTGALKTLRHSLPEAADVLRTDITRSLSAWTRALDLKLLPRLEPDFPVLAAVCGGGSAGKSTLFNSLVGQAISPTGGRAGLNRRVLIATHPDHAHSDAFDTFLGESFGAPPESLEQTAQLTEPGAPLIWRESTAPANTVLLDTPDIDTGARGLYANRELSQQTLEAADLFIYIFTNATYNNRDNTDFISGLLTAVGKRPCFLVYRVYPSFSDQEVDEHARTVAQNLYGVSFREHVLGVYRADEDNDVAAGRKAVVMRPVGQAPQTLSQALAGLDGPALRGRVLASTFRDCVRQAGDMFSLIRKDREALERYQQLLDMAQQQSIQQALSHFPTDRVLRRFADIWLRTDPAHIKVMRRTGRVVEWPYRALVKTIGVLRETADTPKPALKNSDPAGQLEMDLLAAAHQLQRYALDARLCVDGREAEAHPAVLDVQNHLNAKDWTGTLKQLADNTEQILSWSKSLESELRTLADDMRRRMGLWDQVRQTFAALLNVIPATAAVTYILHTGDPIGASGLKIKLTGLFGLNDLYALIAIPTTAGLKKADQRQLEQMLQPVARTWLAHKAATVQELFEKHITGDLLRTARQATDRSGELAGAVSAALDVCREALDV